MSGTATIDRKEKTDGLTTEQQDVLCLLLVYLATEARKSSPFQVASIHGSANPVVTNRAAPRARRSRRGGGGRTALPWRCYLAFVQCSKGGMTLALIPARLCKVKLAVPRKES
jgi:hypothetical protein